MIPSYRIVFYISGHGLGHASRTIEVIRALVQREPAAAIAVRTSAPRHLFANTLGSPVEVAEVECDTGMVQIDSLHVDEAASVARAKAFHARLADRAAAEAAHLRNTGVDLVVADIPPLAFAAAAAAGIPSVAISNFTWDWIYAGYPEQSPGELVDQIRSLQQTAHTALRLPISGGFAGLEKVTRAIPFVARHSKREPGEVRRWLGLDETRRLLLLSFGGYGLADLNTARVGALDGYDVVTTDFPVQGCGIAEAKGIINLPERRLYGDGLRYEDLVRAADVVVTKPGHGIVSECIANDTAILYTSRGRFPEYDLFVRDMPKFLRVQFIEQRELLAGNWRPALETLLSSPRPGERPDTNGAEVAAAIILDVLRRN
jgi:hypothetical protein